MRLRYFSLAAAVMTFSLSSCSFGSNIDNLMTPPKLGPEQEQIYSKLTTSLNTSNISLKYPKSGKYLSAFIIEDIDGDVGNEALVFYERNNHAADENPLHINVLDKKEDGEWTSATSRHDDHWVVEIEFPFSTFGEPAEGIPWLLGLNRCGPGIRQSWTDATYHSPNSFKTLRMDAHVK